MELLMGRRFTWIHVAAIFITVVVLSNTASADTFPVRKYTDSTIAIVSNHTQITASRTAFRGDVWLSKMNGGKGGYLMDTIKNTRKLNATLVSIKAQLRPVGCVENNTKSALFNFTTNEYFNCTCKAGWAGQDCAIHHCAGSSHRYWRLRLTEYAFAYNVKEIQFFSDIARYDDTQSTIAEPWSGTNSLHVKENCINSAQYGGHGCDRAFDNNIDSWWSNWAAGSGNMSWIGMDFETPQKVSHVRFMNGRDLDSNQGHVMVVEFSDDKSTWTEWTGERIVTQPKEQSQTSTSRTNTWQEAISKCSVPNRNPSYTHYTKACVGGHDIIKFTGKTVEQCKEICSAMLNCVAFEFGVAYGGAGGYQAGDCQPQSSTNRAGCDGSYYNLDLYEKDPYVGSFININGKELYQDSDGWILLLAYKHVGGENKALVQGTAPTSPTEGYSHVWLNDLGLTAGDVDSVRFYCHTSGHSRKMHFSTSDATIKSFLIDGRTTGNTASLWTSGTSKFSDHTAYLPDATTHTLTSLTEFPFYKGATYHWGIKGSTARFECDDYPGNFAKSTLHQIWFKRKSLININDLYQDSGGWILLLAYKHVGGENKALVQGTAPTSPTEGYSHVWLNDLGLTAGDVDSVRFYCHTSGHSRKMHFSTSDATIKSFLIDGRTTGNTASLWTSGTSKFSDHTAYLPDVSNSVWSSSLTEFPFYKSGTYHWAIKGSDTRFECDDVPGNYAKSTLHQIWFKRKSLININDLYQDSGGWILLLAYKHVGGENKALVQGTAPTSPTEGYSHVWLNDLGLTAGDVDSVRFYCHTSGHSRKMHFSTSDATIKSFLIDGRTTGNTASLWTSGTSKFSDHTAYLPDVSNSVWSSSLTEFPFYKSGTYHWAIKGSDTRFECDDVPGNYAKSTLHQIWFKRKQ